MSPPTRITEFFETLAKVLLRCWVFGFLLLLLWACVFLLARDVLHNVHSRMFGLSSHELDIIHYCGMAFVKRCLLLFFLLPWISIRLVWRKAEQLPCIGIEVWLPEVEAV